LNWTKKIALQCLYYENLATSWCDKKMLIIKSIEFSFPQSRGKQRDEIEKYDMTLDKITNQFIYILLKLLIVDSSICRERKELDLLSGRLQRQK
jgi:hypothetical protein